MEQPKRNLFNLHILHPSKMERAKIQMEEISRFCLCILALRKRINIISHQKRELELSWCMGLLKRYLTSQKDIHKILEISHLPQLRQEHRAENLTRAELDLLPQLWEKQLLLLKTGSRRVSRSFKTLLQLEHRMLQLQEATT